MRRRLFLPSVALDADLRILAQELEFLSMFVRIPLYMAFESTAEDQRRTICLLAFVTLFVH